MKFRGTLIMGMAFLVLGGYFFFVELPQEEKEKAEKARNEKILDFKEPEVENVILTRPDQEVHAKRTGLNQWVLEQPLKYPANTSAMTRSNSRSALTGCSPRTTSPHRR